MHNLSREDLEALIKKIIRYSRFLPADIIKRTNHLNQKQLETLTIALYQALQTEINLMPEAQKDFETLTQEARKINQNLLKQAQSYKPS